MAFIRDTAYTDGQPLNVDRHNLNLYNAENPTRGILTRLNGAIDESDLAPGFRANRSHIWPGQVFRAEQAFMIRPLEIFSEAYEDGDLNNVEYHPIVGASMRFYVPYNCSAAVLNVEAFMSPFRTFRIKAFGGKRKYYMSTALYFDGDFVNGSLRKQPFTNLLYVRGAYENMTTGTFPGTHTSVGGLLNFEPQWGLPMSMHYIRHPITKGFHDIHLAARIESPTLSGRDFGWITGTRSVIQRVTLGQRLFVGIRNARVLTIL